MGRVTVGICKPCQWYRYPAASAELAWADLQVPIGLDKMRDTAQVTHAAVLQANNSSIHQDYSITSYCAASICATALMAAAADTKLFH